MIIFLAPLSLAVTRSAVKYCVANAISGGISRAKSEVEIKTIRKVMLMLFELALTFLLLVAAIHVVPLVFDSEAVIFAVCSVYLGSFIKAVFDFLGALPVYFAFVFKYKFSLEDHIRAEIHSEALRRARRKIGSKGFIARGLNSLFGETPSSIADSIANSTTRMVVNKVLLSIVCMATVVFVYIWMFRGLVAEALMVDAAGLSWAQEALYPLLYSIDYFLGTALLR